MRKLSYKEKGFIKDFIKTKNATYSALKNYDVKSRDVARRIGSENLSKPDIRKTIDQYLEASEYDPLTSISTLQEIQSDKRAKVTGSDRINASIHLLKLANLYQEKKLTANYNIDLNNLDKVELDKLNRKYQNILKKKKPNTQT